MAYIVNNNQFLPIINGVYDPIITDSNAIKMFRPGEFGNTTWKRVRSQKFHSLCDAMQYGVWKFFEILFDGIFKADVIEGHFFSSAFSCWQG